MRPLFYSSQMSKEHLKNERNINFLFHIFWKSFLVDGAMWLSGIDVMCGSNSVSYIPPSGVLGVSPPIEDIRDIFHFDIWSEMSRVWGFHIFFAKKVKFPVGGMSHTEFEPHITLFVYVRKRRITKPSKLNNFWTLIRIDILFFLKMLNFSSGKRFWWSKYQITVLKLRWCVSLI